MLGVHLPSRNGDDVCVHLELTRMREHKSYRDKFPESSLFHFNDYAIGAIIPITERPSDLLIIISVLNLLIFFLTHKPSCFQSRRKTSRSFILLHFLQFFQGNIERRRAGHDLNYRTASRVPCSSLLLLHLQHTSSSLLLVNSGFALSSKFN